MATGHHLDKPPIQDLFEGFIPGTHELHLSIRISLKFCNFTYSHSITGCFSKDQVYLTGIFEILRYRHRIDFHSLVRLGKVARQDVERLKPQAVLDPKTVKIPFFMLDLQAYKAKLHYIMSKNGITDVELVRLYPDVDGEVWGAER